MMALSHMNIYNLKSLFCHQICLTAIIAYTVFFFQCVGNGNKALTSYAVSLSCINVKSKLISIYHDVAVIQWITSCHKNRMTTCYITLGYWRVTS